MRKPTQAHSGRLAIHRSAAVRFEDTPAAKCGPVHVSRVDARAWNLAIRLAVGDLGRVRILDRRTVLMLNQPRWSR